MVEGVLKDGKRNDDTGGLSVDARFAAAGGAIVSSVWVYASNNTAKVVPLSSRWLRWVRWWWSIRGRPRERGPASEISFHLHRTSKHARGSEHPRRWPIDVPSIRIDRKATLPSHPRHEWNGPENASPPNPHHRYPHQVRCSVRRRGVPRRGWHNYQHNGEADPDYPIVR